MTFDTTIILRRVPRDIVVANIGDLRGGGYIESNANID